MVSYCRSLFFLVTFISGALGRKPPPPTPVLNPPAPPGISYTYTIGGCICDFPFTFNNQQYYTCTLDRAKKYSVHGKESPWCVTRGTCGMQVQGMDRHHDECALRLPPPPPPPQTDSYCCKEDGCKALSEHNCGQKDPDHGKDHCGMCADTESQCRKWYGVSATQCTDGSTFCANSFAPCIWLTGKCVIGMPRSSTADSETCALAPQAPPVPPNAPDSPGRPQRDHQHDPQRDQHESQPPPGPARPPRPLASPENEIELSPSPSPQANIVSQSSGITWALILALLAACTVGGGCWVVLNRCGSQHINKQNRFHDEDEEETTSRSTRRKKKRGGGHAERVELGIEMAGDDLPADEAQDSDSRKVRLAEGISNGLAPPSSASLPGAGKASCAMACAWDDDGDDVPRS